MTSQVLRALATHDRGHELAHVQPLSWAATASNGTTEQAARMTSKLGQPAWRALVTGYVRFVRLYEQEGQRILVLAPHVPPPNPQRALSCVEARAARLAGQAYSNKEISTLLGISESAAENHLSRAMSKIEIDNRILLVILYTWLELANEV